MGFYDYFFKDEIAEHAKENLDIARWARRLAGRPKQAANVNALDEVPDSSWYTNRHHLHGMTIEELVRGPNRGAPPDFTGATIMKANDRRHSRIPVERCGGPELHHQIRQCKISRESVSG